MQNLLQCGRYQLPVSHESRPLVMGILNVTPDSFSDGGLHASLAAAVARAEEMIEQGADIIDVGGESSRPGAEPLPLEQELERVMPVLAALKDCGKPLSVDTYKPAVMREAIAAGADMVNDITGFRDAQAIAAVKDSNCALCIMHMQNDPQTMQLKPEYLDVVNEVGDFLLERATALKTAGIDANRLCVDPGFGFGKTLEHNLDLLRNLSALRKRLRLPILAGVSRKGMIGALTGRELDQRVAGSVSAALAAAVNGARILRVHDVRETVDALKVWQAAMPQPA